MDYFATLLLYTVFIFMDFSVRKFLSAPGLEERHHKIAFNLSGERERVERCDGGIPMAQGFHREVVSSHFLASDNFTSQFLTSFHQVDLKIWNDRFHHHKERKVPGSVANTKFAFNHTNVR